MKFSDEDRDHAIAIVRLVVSKITGWKKTDPHKSYKYAMLTSMDSTIASLERSRDPFASHKPFDIVSISHSYSALSHDCSRYWLSTVLGSDGSQ